MNDPIIRTANLVKTYGSGAAASHALRGITLEIPRGSFTCIVGPSGHGKSTLMHLLGGLDRPSSGTVTVAGKPSLDVPPGTLNAILKQAGLKRETN